MGTAVHCSRSGSSAADQAVVHKDHNGCDSSLPSNLPQRQRDTELLHNAAVVHGAPTHTGHGGLLHDLLGLLVKLLAELHHVDAQRSKRLPDGRPRLGRARRHPHPYSPHERHFWSPISPPNPSLERFSEPKKVELISLHLLSRGSIASCTLQAVGWNARFDSVCCCDRNLIAMLWGSATSFSTGVALFRWWHCCQKGIERHVVAPIFYPSPHRSGF